MKFIVSSAIIGISLIISASILKGTIFTSPNDSAIINPPAQILSVSTKIMTKKQLSEYVQVSEKTIDSIMEEDKKFKLSAGDSYDTYMLLPYLKIGNQVRFLKPEIDKWIQYQNDNPLR